MSPRPGGRLDPDELAALEDQRDFLLASLADLEREHDAGDLDDADHVALRDEYTARAAEVLRAIDEQRQAFAAARRPRDRKRTLLTVGAIAVFAVVAGWLVARSLGARAPGQAITGPAVKQTTSQRAQACIGLIDEKAPKAAIACFEDIRKEDPDNVVALTWSAWQLSLSSQFVPAEIAASLQDTAATQLAKAVELQPSYSQARAFRAVVAYRSGRYDDARTFLQEFLDNDPDADSRQTIEDMDLAGLIEAGEAAGGSTTTTSSSTTTTTTPTAPG